MSDQEVQNTMLQVLRERGTPVAARELVTTLKNDRHIQEEKSRRALLRLADNNQVRITPDRKVAVAG